jgi:uncharacterized membrane protein
MTYYESLVLVHVLAAIVWVGGGVAVQFFALRALRAREPGRIAAFSGDVEWLGTRVFLPASVVVLVAGILAVAEAGWGWGSTWISIGFAGIAVSIVVGSGFLGPESGRIARLVAAEGPESAAVRARVRRILLVSRLELLVLLVVVWAMVTKPGL